VKARPLWFEGEGRVRCEAEGRVLFDDSAEHWREALLRLMCWTPEQCRSFVEESVSAAGGPAAWAAAATEARLKAMVRAAAALSPEPAASASWQQQDLVGLEFLGAPLSKFWTRALGGNAALALAGTDQPAHGVLLRRADGRAHPAAAPIYEEEYFEGSQDGYGYGKLREQSGWRLEKSARQARQLRGLLDFFGALPADRAPRLLDVGSGYGFLRAAAGDLGWYHEGVEVSRHACDAAKGMFGFESFQGNLGAHASRGFDCVSMMDLVEHVADPITLLKQVAQRLVPGGLCVIRTPNLLAAEREVFGHCYHSLKAEHLHCFSPESLSRALAGAGLEPVFCVSESHLFRGLLGQGTAILARTLRGSDLLAAGQRPR
jgi:2-polyprenyl-3-methyl-5-hydroxy-6-metoxy-1,4-benzoquinol methylase